MNTVDSHTSANIPVIIGNRVPKYMPRSASRRASSTCRVAFCTVLKIPLAFVFDSFDFRRSSEKEGDVGERLTNDLNYVNCSSCHAKLA
jgi:hypothetical protein